MRYTIEGFSQEEAVKFRRIEIVNGKEKAVTLDCTDLVILRWFVDFWPNMMKVEISGRQYAWLSYKAAIEDMPLLGIKKGMFALRLKKLVDFGILTHKTIKSGGTFSYYGFGPQYARLTDSKHAQKNADRTQDINGPLPNLLDTPAQNISDQINPNTKDADTKRPKERKKPDETFDAIIDGFTDNGELREALRDFLRYRKASGKVLTNRGLKLNLTRLSNLADDPVHMVAIVNQTIERGWTGFFELKDQTKGHGPQSPKPVQEVGYDEELQGYFDALDF